MRNLNCSIISEQVKKIFSGYFNGVDLREKKSTEVLTQNQRDLQDHKPSIPLTLSLKILAMRTYPLTVSCDLCPV